MATHSSILAAVQFSSVVPNSLRPHGPQHARLPSFTISQSLLKLMSIESVMPYNHFIPFRPLLLLPSIFPTIRVVSNDSVLHTGWPKYWNLSFSISPSNEYLGLISFTIDWFDLSAVKGSLSRVFFSTTVGRHQFFGAQLYLWSNSHMHT